MHETVDGQEAELDPRVRGVLEVPIHRFLGVELTDPKRPAAGIVFSAREPALNNVGVLHGGVVTALLDVASYLAVLPSLGRDENAVTHSTSASLLRSVAAGSRVHVRGELVRRGRTTAFLRAEASVDGTTVAIGQVTKSVISAAG